jgi:hypothetical protein
VSFSYRLSSDPSVSSDLRVNASSARGIRPQGCFDMADVVLRKLEIGRQADLVKLAAGFSFPLAEPDDA